MIIKIPIEKLEEQSANIKNELSNLRYNLNCIESLVYGLEGEWQGDAARSFSRQIIELRAKYIQIEDFLEHQSFLMDKYIDESKQLERDISSSITKI